jgi:hypothetical protein
MTRPTTPDEAALQAWCALVLEPLGYSVLFDDQRYPELTPPWASIRLLSETPDSTTESRADYNDVADEVTIKRSESLSNTVRVTVCGGDHKAAARSLGSSLRRADVKALNKAAGLGVTRLSTARLPIGTASGGVASDRSISDFAYNCFYQESDPPTDQYVQDIGINARYT